MTRLFIGMVQREYPVYDEHSPVEPNAPQALLRDLHRVTKRFEINPFAMEKVSFRLDGGRRYTAWIKPTLAQRYRVPILELVPTRKLWKEGYRELREILRSDWTQAPKLASAQVEVSHLALADYLPG